jgi:hypothetical protein
VGVDGGAPGWGAQRLQRDCVTELVTATGVDELVRRLDGAACGARQIGVLEAPAIAHPRSPPRPAAATGKVARRTPAWQRPWVWMAVVSAVAVGVVVGVNVWPREATYSATVDFHRFALSR